MEEGRRKEKEEIGEKKEGVEEKKREEGEEREMEQKGQVDAVVAFIIIGPSVLTYVLNSVALRHVAASTVAAFTYVQPIFTAGASYLLLHQAVNPHLWPAAALVFVGVWLVARKSPKILEGQTVAE